MKIPIAKEGYKPIKIFLLFGITFYILGTISQLFYLLSFICCLLSVFLIFFFRDPERKILPDETKILSPADGRIISIEETPISKTIKIFLSPFDVHVQRSPCSGVIESIEYKKGNFIPAFKSEAAPTNEQNIIVLRLPSSVLRLIVKQIAGNIARRIICWVHPEEEVIQGQRLGMIFLGSQVELQLPSSVELKVQLGQKVKSGLTVIAEIH